MKPDYRSELGGNPNLYVNQQPATTTSNQWQTRMPGMECVAQLMVTTAGSVRN
jgi:hypothetical protein